MTNPYKGMLYQDYLITVHWQKTREQKLKDAGYKCEQCPRDENLEVHHLTYERLGEERMGDLQALCPICHRKTHGIEPTSQDWSRARTAFGHETMEAHRQLMAQRRAVRDLEGRV